MIVNNVDIKVETDYTAFTNTVNFQVAVPINADNAATIYEDLAKGDWSKTQEDIETAIKKTAPAQVQTLVTALLAAYNGTSSSSDNGTTETPKPEEQPADETQT